MGAPEFVYIDDHLLVVDKPAGLLAVPGRGEHNADCVSARVQAIYPDALVVHRLDMATSGLMMFARTRAIQRRLGIAFQDRTVTKQYVAIVEGVVPGFSAGAASTGSWHIIDLPIGADWIDRPRRKIDQVSGKPSQTRYAILPGTGGDPALGATTRLLLEPVTGRTHQLRVHLRALGHPIVGDALYASAIEAPRLMLHAAELRLQHPESRIELRLRSAVPF